MLMHFNRLKPNCQPPNRHGKTDLSSISYTAETHVAKMSVAKMIMAKAPSSCCVASVVSDPVRLHTPQPTRLLCPWDSPGKNIGVGCHFLL